MKKRALSLTLALVMCLGLTISASAAEDNYFSKNGLPISQEPPKGAVNFTYILEDAKRLGVDPVMSGMGEFYVDSCTTTPVNQAGYRTTTLKARAEMLTMGTPTMQGNYSMSNTLFSLDLYDYYTGQNLNIGDSTGDTTNDNTQKITYNGKTCSIAIKCSTTWENINPIFIPQKNWLSLTAVCHLTFTITTSADYDGLVFMLGNKTEVTSSDSDAISYADGKNAAIFFRFGPKAPTPQAIPTNDKLTVDGVEQDPTVYKINGSNYFKIRDLAAVLNGTEKQFEVGYDNATKSVTATTGKGYDKGPNDLVGAASSNETATLSNDTIYVDGAKIQAEVYKIAGNNYFKLRDLGKALDFYVGYEKGKGMFIDTTKPYTE